MKVPQVTALLGLAQKARKLASGELAVEQAVRSGKAKLLIAAVDASENTRKNYRDMAAYYQITYHEALSKEQLGDSIGKPPRAALAITDAGFTKAIIQALRG